MRLHENGLMLTMSHCHRIVLDHPNQNNVQNIECPQVIKGEPLLQRRLSGKQRTG